MLHKRAAVRRRSPRVSTRFLGFVIFSFAFASTPLLAQNDVANARVASAYKVYADPFGVAGFDCSRLDALGIGRQMNPRAGAILNYCGRGVEGRAPDSLVNIAYSRPSSLLAFGGTDINLINGAPETHPKVTQNESSVWAHGNTIVVAMDDSRLSSTSYCAVSVSTNGGATFSRLAYDFTIGGGPCFGDPSVFYSKRAGKWFIGFLTQRCTGGYGQWESVDGITWTASGCYVSGVMADLLSTWVDNNSLSPFYGRQYATFNNYSVANAPPQIVYSSNDGVTFSAPVTVTPFGRRAVKVTGSYAVDGTVYVQTMDEGGGGLGSRTNYIHRSTDGAATWSPALAQGPSFFGPGRSVSGFFAGMYTTPGPGYWRHMGWGRPGVGLNGVVHYAYASRPGTPSTDAGNIFYVRSTDNGSTWSPPVQLNTDGGVKAQFQPSLAVNAQGKLIVTWFDERNDATTPPAEPNTLQRFGRASVNNGVTWGPDMPVSDVLFPKPLQPDPAVQAIDVGDKHDAAFSDDGNGNTAYDTWTDGRVSINGAPQQDVFFDKVNFGTRAPFDFDGDGKTDIGIFRPASAQWWINRSSVGTTYALQFGAPTDLVVPSDYTGDGKSDIAFFRPSSGEWYILRSEDSSFYLIPFGTNGDIPTPADYDSDGKSDLGVFRPSNSTWYLNRSTGGTAIAQFGAGGDLPVADDYDGDGRADLAIYRPSNGQWWLNRSTVGLIVYQFGSSTDRVVQGDYTGDGKSDVALWRPSTGEWFILRSDDLSYYSQPFGTTGDTPSPGDYDGDGKFDTTVFRPSSATWYVNRSTAGTLIQQFGATGDRPIPNAFVR